MDSTSFTPAIFELLSLLIVYCFWRIIAKSINKREKNTAPEPSGAWPLIGHLPLLNGQEPICKILGALADKYGPIYSLRLGKHPILIVSGWEIVKDCFTTNDRILATRAKIVAGKYMGYDNAIFALAPYSQYWRDIRKIATTELLSSHRLELLKHVRYSEVDTFIKDLYSLCSENAFNPAKVVISKLIEQLTFNISLKLIAGKRFSAKDYEEQGSEAWRINRAIKEATHLFGVFVLGDAIPWLESIDFQGHVGSMKSTAKEIDDVIGNWLKEHLQKKLQGEGHNGKGDLIDVLLSKLQEDAVMGGHTRDIVVKATALILILTGSESTYLGIIWTLSLLLNHPKELKKAQEELDVHVGRDRWVNESDMKNLKYLRAIVKETLRIYPPGPVTGIREAMEDCEIGGYHVPKGTRLIVNIWKLHRDPRMWENPCEFRPERFLTTHADVDVNTQHFEYIPFSFGRRSCPGMTSGLQIVQLTLARILQGFDLATVGGTPVGMQIGLGLALPKSNPLEVIIKPRLAEDLFRCI
ncbi:Dimethylnonatriene synthase [Citrus sinensis]|uniref:dimethylnonatriene synthase-like n=1 Tax=Citrus sinensis TaxID=2711 RepID=UPI00218E9599|nr:dimethylnonatriene synthase-like [Citrus sinensis]KAH9728725.1 Dimethylnonatriene synthase [Citrus sinensis]